MKTTLIVWREQNNIDIPFIDEQHRGIVSLINSLHYFNTQNESRHIIERTVKSINQYTRLHFYTEETLFKRFNYPRYEDHKSRHDRLISLMEEKEREYLNSEATDFYAYLMFLKKWWIDHVNNIDRRYVSFLKSAMKKT